MENKLKYLEFIQVVISRMGSNSFLVKGWSVTLLAAIFALSDKEADHRYAIVVYLPILSFWGLDAYFLLQERLFRSLFRDVSGRAPPVDFSMDTKKFDGGKNTWLACLKSKTIILFHGTLLLVTLIIMFAIPPLEK